MLDGFISMGMSKFKPNMITTLNHQPTEMRNSGISSKILDALFLDEKDLIMHFNLKSIYA